MSTPNRNLPEIQVTHFKQDGADFGPMHPGNSQGGRGWRGRVIDAKFREVRPPSRFRWYNPLHLLGVGGVLVKVTLNWALRNWEHEHFNFGHELTLRQRLKLFGAVMALVVGVVGIGTLCFIFIEQTGLLQPRAEASGPTGGYLSGQIVRGRTAAYQYLGGDYRRRSNWRAVN